ncbi:MAG: hypothetical protein ACT4PO_08890 [Actinomycetota bacterium]
MGKFFRMCLDWRVVVALAAVGLGVWALAPNLLASLGPLLVLAVCPLSMILMMAAMRGGSHASTGDDAAHADTSGRPHDRRLAELEARRAALSREIAQLEEDEAVQSPPGRP